MKQTMFVDVSNILLNRLRVETTVNSVNSFASYPVFAVIYVGFAGS